MRLETVGSFQYCCVVFLVKQYIVNQYYGVCVRVSAFLKLSSWANTGVLTGVHFSFMGAVVILFVSQIYQSYIKMRDVNELYYFDGFVDE